MTLPLIVLENYAGVRALRDVSLTVNAGEVVGLIGENGAGKSTLMKVLGGLVEPTSGTITLDGRPLDRLTVGRSLGADIAFVHQELNLFDNLDAAANVFMGEAAFGMVAMDVETGVRSGMPILTIVMRNGIMGGYGGFMPTATQKYAANRLGGEYDKVAEGLGAYTERVAKPDELIPALRRAIKQISSGKTALLVVETHEEPRLADLATEAGLQDKG